MEQIQKWNFIKFIYISINSRIQKKFFRNKRHRSSQPGAFKFGRQHFHLYEINYHLKWSNRSLQSVQGAIEQGIIVPLLQLRYRRNNVSISEQHAEGCRIHWRGNYSLFKLISLCRRLLERSRKLWKD